MIDPDVAKALADLRAGQLEIAAGQKETLDLIRSEAEHARRIREEALSLQRRATARARQIGFFALIGIVLCVFMIVYLITKYHIL